MISFQDNFSKQADIYSKYRPAYPYAMYDYLSSLCSSHQLVWDCGTGNGQAAISLASFFEKVYATDPSEAQIRNSFPHSRVIYTVEAAESVSLPNDSVDLITCANALHWFQLEEFFAEVTRVSKPGCVLAVWCYGIPAISEKIDKIIQDFHDNTLNEYWRAENRLVEKEYRDIRFPFEPVDKIFYSEKLFDLNDLICYLNTWSATQRFITENGFNPTHELKEELKEVWEDENEVKKISWKIILKVGTVK